MTVKGSTPNISETPRSFMSEISKVTPAGAVLANAGSYYAGKKISPDGSDATGTFAYSFSRTVFSQLQRSELMQRFFGGAEHSPNNPLAAKSPDVGVGPTLANAEKIKPKVLGALDPNNAVRTLDMFKS